MGTADCTWTNSPATIRSYSAGPVAPRFRTVPAGTEVRQSLNSADTESVDFRLSVEMIQYGDPDGLGSNT
jgi:hypothetical protein